MYWGILGVSAIAFSCSTEFIPEINTKMKLVPFTSEFRSKMTITMIVDYLGCYVIEKVLKWAFSDYKPKDIALRRPDQLRREEERREKEIEEKQRKEDELQKAKVEEMEKKLREKGWIK